MNQLRSLDPTPLPTVFCWTRFGTEAGEAIERILERKEAERRATGGVFYWGIGNSVAPGILELLQRTNSPEVLFSPIKSRPRQVDETPTRVVTWTWAQDLDGKTFALPEAVRISSHQGTNSTRRPHYALVCSSPERLEFAEHGWLNFGGLRNLVSGRRLGGSQVTAVVTRLEDWSGGSRCHPVALRATLAAPYFVRLCRPVPIIRSSKAPA